MSEKPSAKIERAVGGWPGVRKDETERGTPGFYYGRIELGHLHGESVADLPFPRSVRDELIAEGRASVHPPLPRSGWVRRRMDGAGDAEAVVSLFRLNYDRARAREERRAAAKEG